MHRTTTTAIVQLKCPSCWGWQTPKKNESQPKAQPCAYHIVLAQRSGMWLRLKFMLKQPPQRGGWMHHRPISYFHQQTLLLWLLVLVDRFLSLESGKPKRQGLVVGESFKEGRGLLFPWLMFITEDKKQRKEKKWNVYQFLSVTLQRTDTVKS